MTQRAKFGTGDGGESTARGRKRWALAVVATVTAGLALAACSANAGSDTALAESMSSAAEYQLDSGAPEAQAGGAAQPPAEDAGAGGNDAYSAADQAESPAREPSSGPLPDGRQIIRTAAVTVTVEVEPAEGERRATDEALAAAAASAARAVRALVTLPGGYVSGSDGRGSTVTITLRIPAGSYDSVMDRLNKIGTVSDIEESTQDVTGQLVDVKSRIASQRASVDRLRALMAEAKSMQDVIAIESELSRREADLESLESQQTSLSDAVALSTISVTVDAVTKTEPAEPEPPAEEHNAFMTGLIAGWHGLVTAATALSTVLGGLLPFLIPLGLIGWGLWWVVRRRRAGARQLPAPAGDALHVGADVDQVDQDADQGNQP